MIAGAWQSAKLSADERRRPRAPWTAIRRERRAIAATGIDRQQDEQREDGVVVRGRPGDEADRDDGERAPRRGAADELAALRDGDDEPDDQRDRVVGGEEQMRLVAQQVVGQEREQHRRHERRRARRAEVAHDGERGHRDQREAQQEERVEHDDRVAEHDPEDRHDHVVHDVAERRGEVEVRLAERRAEVGVVPEPAVLEDALDARQVVRGIARRPRRSGRARPSSRAAGRRSRRRSRRAPSRGSRGARAAMTAA